jgi:protein-S-isoprenylcysteine O-methyltransferase Ste14
VTTGLHARVRHPIYLAHLCMLLGFTIGSGLSVDYALLGFTLIAGAVMIALEERELERRFGEEWREYKSRSGAIFPKSSANSADANVASEARAR